MNEVQWIGGGPVTKEQIDFFLGPATHDMIEEELQLKHKVSQDIPTVPIFEDRTNLIYSQIKEEGCMNTLAVTRRLVLMCILPLLVFR